MSCPAAMAMTNSTAAQANDQLAGDAGEDVLNGGDGNDTITDSSINGVAAIDGGVGDDQINVSGAQYLAGIIDGGFDNDTLRTNISINNTGSCSRTSRR